MARRKYSPIEDDAETAAERAIATARDQSVALAVVAASLRDYLSGGAGDASLAAEAYRLAASIDRITAAALGARHARLELRGTRAKRAPARR